MRFMGLISQAFTALLNSVLLRDFILESLYQFNLTYDIN